MRTGGKAQREFKIREDASNRLRNLWNNLLRQFHNQMYITQTSEKADMESLDLIFNAVKQTYWLFKPRLTLGDQAILERQYLIISVAFKVMGGYNSKKDFDRLIELRKRFEEIMNLLQS